MNIKHIIQLFILLISYSIQGVAQLPTPPVPLPPAEDEIFRVVEEMPRFPGCEHLDASDREKELCAKDMMLEYIYKELIYPLKALENDVEGMAVVQFIIWNDGSIRGVKIKRDPGAGTGNEAARIVESMMDLDKKWRPGYQRGRAVCVQYTLPVKFKLDDDHSRPTPKYSKGYEIVQLYNLDEDPIFPDCHKKKYKSCTSKKLQEFIKENQLYPDLALENNSEGIVKISFIIELDGTLSNIKATNKLPDGLCEDAIEIFEWMNSEDMRWSPGKKNYRTVRTQYYVDVAYDLEDWKSRN